MATWLHKQRISQCCCGCTVRTGSLIISFFEVAFALIQIIFLFVQIDESISGGDAGYAGQIASCVLSFLVGLTLLLGVHKNSTDFLLPYLLLRTISWFLMNLAIGILLVLSFVSQAYILLLLVLLFIIASALLYYFLRCVYSFYLDLTDEKNSIRQKI